LMLATTLHSALKWHTKTSHESRFSESLGVPIFFPLFDFGHESWNGEQVIPSTFLFRAEAVARFQELELLDVRGEHVLVRAEELQGEVVVFLR